MAIGSYLCDISVGSYQRLIVYLSKWTLVTETAFDCGMNVAYYSISTYIKLNKNYKAVNWIGHKEFSIPVKFIPKSFLFVSSN
jgi:hypothetical protein